MYHVSLFDEVLLTVLLSTAYCRLVTQSWVKTAHQTFKIDLASISMVLNFRKTLNKLHPNFSV